MSMGYGELEASTDKQVVAKAPRKAISLKLKREAAEELAESSEPEQEIVKEQSGTLNWSFKVKLSGERKRNKENLLNFCEKCKRPILVHGRLIPCKHFLCLACAQKGTRNCFKCETPIKGIQPVPKIYVCAHGGTRHSLQGCRKSYLNFAGLDQHQKLRHNGDESQVDANVDSDGELSVNKQSATKAAPQPAPAATPATQYTMPATAVSMPVAVPSIPPVVMPVHPSNPLSRPTLVFPQMQPGVSVAQTVLANATRLTMAAHAPRPTAVLLFPRPQMTVSSMAPLLVPARPMGAPQMLNMPGMLPQPAGMMPIPTAQFQTIQPPQSIMAHMVARSQAEPMRPQMPSLPMPEQMRDNGMHQMPHPSAMPRMPPSSMSPSQGIRVTRPPVSRQQGPPPHLGMLVSHSQQMIGPPGQQMPGQLGQQMPGPPPQRMPGPPGQQIQHPHSQQMPGQQRQGPPGQHMHPGPPGQHNPGSPGQQIPGPPGLQRQGPPGQQMPDPPGVLRQGPPGSGSPARPLVMPPHNGPPAGFPPRDPPPAPSVLQRLPPAGFQSRDAPPTGFSTRDPSPAGFPLRDPSPAAGFSPRDPPASGFSPRDPPASGFSPRDPPAGSFSPRDPAPSRDFTPPAREVPGQLRNEHYSPNNDTPPPPPPPAARPSDPRENQSMEFRFDQQYQEYDSAPRDPRKSRGGGGDIPPPPPPRNGNMR